MDLAEYVGRENGCASCRSIRTECHKTWSHCRYPINAGRWKALATKVIERQAYGFRDGAYFILKIEGAFPGKRSSPR